MMKGIILMKRWFILTAFPFAMLLAHIWHFYADVPIYEQWKLDAPLLDKWYSGALTISDIVGIYNGHRMVFPKIITILSAELTHWNMCFEIVVNLIVALATSAILFKMVNCMNVSDDKKKNAIYISLLFLLFSFSQAENWMWGFEVCMFLTNFAAVATFYVLSFSNMTFMTIVGASLLTILGTYSFANGMFIFPSALFILMIRHSSPEKRKYLICYFLVAGGAILGYFIDFHSSADGSIAQIVQNPLKFLYNSCQIIGNVIYHQYSDVSATLGFICIVSLFFFSYRYVFSCKDYRYINAALLGISLYVLLSVFAVAYGRGNYLTCIASRYLTVAVWLWIPVLLYAFQFLCDKCNIEKVFLIGMVFLFAFIGIEAGLAEVPFVESRKNGQLVLKEYLLLGKPIDVNTFPGERIFWTKDYLKYIAPLKKWNVHNFENANSELIPDFIEIKNNAGEVKLLSKDKYKLAVDSFEFDGKKKEIFLTGWFFLLEEEAPEHLFYLEFRGERIFTTTLSKIKRDDVQKAFPNKLYHANVGFHLNRTGLLPMDDSLPKGEYDLYLRVKEGEQYFVVPIERHVCIE